MGSTVFPVPSSGAGLPAGATEKVASGFVKNGYASVSGSFPAGKYLVTADTACNVNFTSAMDVNGYQNAIFSKGGSCVVDVPVSTSVIEYTAAPTIDEHIYGTSVATGTTSQPLAGVMARLSKLFNIDNMRFNYSTFTYKGKLISVTNPGIIWKSNDWESGINTGINTGVTMNGGPDYMVGTDGTTWKGFQNTYVAWSTTNPEAGGWSTQSLPNPANHYIYGNGVWLALYTNSLTYSYSTNGGSTWNTGTLPLYANSKSPIAFGNGKFVITSARDVGASNNIAYSTDGINWTSVAIASPSYESGNKYIAGIAFGNGRFVTGWHSSLNTTDIRTSHVFVSVDGINWIPGSRSIHSTTTNSAWHFYPVFDGTGFNFLPYAGAAGWRSIDGINMLQILLSTMYFTTSTGFGTRGNFIDTNGYRINTTKNNSTFAIYKLDPSYTTY